MYQLFIWIYTLCVGIASLFNDKAKRMRKGGHAAFRILREKADPGARYLWFHAASLGEFEQGRPIIEQLRQQHPEYKILLTFFSPSGYEVRKDYPGADICCYLPLDTMRNARRFLRLIRPEMAFFIKYEFWYNYLHELKKQGIPVYSVSSIFRPGQAFFKWYGRPYRQVLYCFTRFFVQNEQSRELLRRIGITDVLVTGDTRFDRVLHIKSQSKQLPLVESFIGTGTPHVFVAGSSWPPDENIFLAYFARHPEWKLIVAPHVIDEHHLMQIEAACQGKALRYSQADEARCRDAAVLIIDCFGLLSSIYRYADVTYVGGGFGVGIHNVLEAAVWNVPVIFGPHNERFREAQQLLDVQGGFEIHDAHDFEALMTRFSTDEEARKRTGDAAGHYVAENAHATDKILAHIFESADKP